MGEGPFFIYAKQLGPMRARGRESWYHHLDQDGMYSTELRPLYSKGSSWIQRMDESFSSFTT